MGRKAEEGRGEDHITVTTFHELEREQKYGEIGRARGVGFNQCGSPQG